MEIYMYKNIIKKNTNEKEKEWNTKLKECSK